MLFLECPACQERITQTSYQLHVVINHLNSGESSLRSPEAAGKNDDSGPKLTNSRTILVEEEADERDEKINKDKIDNRTMNVHQQHVFYDPEKYSVTFKCIENCIFSTDSEQVMIKHHLSKHT